MEVNVNQNQYLVTYYKLLEQIKSLGSSVLAFSGGVDSTLLLKACYDALGDQALAITVLSPYIPKWEVEEAKAIAGQIGIRHMVMEVGIPDAIVGNPENRCYLCKKAIFSMILDQARVRGISHVIDGSNADDTKDYRPGLLALKELEVVSPLMALGITKEEVRGMSKVLGLPTWDKPAYACLLTRLPYGAPLEETSFRQIEAGEVFLMEQGFKAVRVRKHDDLARIEIARGDLGRFLASGIFDQVVVAFKNLGFSYVTLDMAGYKMGSFNENILREEAARQ